MNAALVMKESQSYINCVFDRRKILVVNFMDSVCITGIFKKNLYRK